MKKFEEIDDDKTRCEIKTDLALESAELLINQSRDDSLAHKGVEMLTEQIPGFDIKVTTVEIKTAEGEDIMGRPIGKYITLESAAMKDNQIEAHEEIIKILSDKIASLKKLKKDAMILVAGLGNWNVTPDSLGPKVVSKILVTRAMHESLPEEIKGKTRVVSAISPGVMGITGIETAEIIQGIVDHIKPDLVIAIDALAARCANRINAAVQISNDGISPGAGMGNKRKSLNKDNLGVDVIAIGVPTVVDAATLVNDTMDLMLSEMMKEPGEGSEFYNMLKSLQEEEKYGMIKSVLDPYTGNMFVTPRDVDAVVETLSGIIANAINIALHPGISKDDINRFNS